MFRPIGAACLLSVAGFLCFAAAPATQIAPAPSSPLHDEIINDYMTCQFDALETLLHDKAREIGALPAGQYADIIAVKTAVAECRPPWWPAVKAGKLVQFRPTLYGHTFGVTFDPELKSNSQISMRNDVATLKVNWSAADMDNPAPGEHGFTKGDLLDFSAFCVLGSIDSWSALPPGNVQLNEAGKLALYRYIDFRGNIAGIAYGNPRGRRWGVWLFLDSYNARFAALPTVMGRKALAALFMTEVLSNPEAYPSIVLPQSLPVKNAEATLALALLHTVEKNPWTFAEDNALRTSAKKFSNVNAMNTYTSGLVTLPNKLTLSLDPRSDKPLQPKRDAWIKAQFDKSRGPRPGRK